ncbi:MAG: hypothetical protein M1839_003027, partial [Geoglossum umbratile]
MDHVEMSWLDLPWLLGSGGQEGSEQVPEKPEEGPEEPEEGEKYTAEEFRAILRE